MHEMASLSTDIFSLEKEWLHTVTEHSFETGDVSKKWIKNDLTQFLTIKEIRGCGFRKSFAKGGEFLFTQHKETAKHHCHRMVYTVYFKTIRYIFNNTQWALKKKKKKKSIETQ